MLPGQPNRAVVRIKNVSGAAYAVEEMPGVTIPDQGEIDLLDPDLPSHYADFDSVRRLLEGSETAKLRQDVVAGNIEIVEFVPPY